MLFNLNNPSFNCAFLPIVGENYSLKQIGKKIKYLSDEIGKDFYIPYMPILTPLKVRVSLKIFSSQVRFLFLSKINRYPSRLPHLSIYR